MGFFKQTSPKTVENADALLEEAKIRINKYTHGEVKETLLKLITKRVDAFKDKTPSVRQPSDQKQQQPYIDGYFAFAKALNDYFANPKAMPTPMKTYYTSPLYCHVGNDEDQDYSYTFADKATEALVYTGLTLAVVGLLFIPFNFPAALIIVGVALAITLPSLFYLAAVTHPNLQAVYKEEATLFEAAIELAATPLLTAVNDDDEILMNY